MEIGFAFCRMKFQKRREVYVLLFTPLHSTYKTIDISKFYFHHKKIKIIAVLFIIAQFWKQAKHQSMSKWINKLGYVNILDLMSNYKWAEY